MKYECEKGEVVFRVPNIAEAMIMLGRLKVSPAFFSNMEEFQKTPEYFVFMGNIILELKNYFVSSTFEGVENFDQLLVPRHTNDLIVMAGEFIKLCLGGEEDSKKKL